MSALERIVIILVPIGAIALALVFGVALPRLRRRGRLRSPIAVSLLGTHGAVPPRPPRPAPMHQPDTSEWGEDLGVQAPANPRTAQRVQRADATGTDGMPTVESRAVTDAPHLRLESVTPEFSMRTDARVAGRKSPPRAMEGTLQFLPGRLEVVEGRDVGQEIRFVRQPGDDANVVTIGRTDGPQYRHVQLHEPTVSRLHGKMSFEGKRWRLTNMSKTNPVVVNGTPLEGEGASLVLTDGDRVEMGEVVFRFRAK